MPCTCHAPTCLNCAGWQSRLASRLMPAPSKIWMVGTCKDKRERVARAVHMPYYMPCTRRAHATHMHMMHMHMHMHMPCTCPCPCHAHAVPMLALLRDGEQFQQLPPRSVLLHLVARDLITVPLRGVVRGVSGSSRSTRSHHRTFKGSNTV
eukprot:scaffold52769_cov63-Phaeocystis_antarctica.AAC.6